MLMHDEFTFTHAPLLTCSWTTYGMIMTTVYNACMLLVVCQWILYKASCCDFELTASNLQFNVMTRLVWDDWWLCPWWRQHNMLCLLQCWLVSLSTAPMAHVEWELIDWFNKWIKLLNSFWVNECSASMVEPEGLSCGLKMHFAHWLYIVCMILWQPFDIPPLDGLPPPI